MKWYLAGRTKQQAQLKAYADQIRASGHGVVSSWVDRQVLDTNYKENIQASREHAERVVKETKDADIFVLMSDRAGTDMFVELGIALAQAEHTKIYIVGEHGNRSLMQLHPHIEHRATMEEVYREEGFVSGR